jgi:hypothetical protein
MIPKRSWQQSLFAAVAGMLGTHYGLKLMGIDRDTQRTKYEVLFFTIFAVVYFGALYLPLLWKKPAPPSDGSTP